MNDDTMNQIPAPTEPTITDQPDQLPSEIAQAQANARQLEQPPIEPPTVKEESISQKLSPKSSADWNELRKAKQQAERKIEELERRLAQQGPVEDELQIDPNEIPEGKHLVKINQELKKVKKELRETQEDARIRQQQAYEAAAEARLQAEYPDIHRILRQENFDVLRQKHPVLAATINKNPDFYEKAVATYDAIKNLGIAGNTELNDYNETRIKDNMAKPRALSSVAPRNDNPLTRANAFANGLTPELQKALQKEMAEAMSNH